jgi:starch synthase
MNFWLPYIVGGSGADISTRALAQGLRAAGHHCVCKSFTHNLQYFPWWLKTISPPAHTDAIITNTWNGFVFHRADSVNITVERLFVLDPAYRPYRSFSQAVFHEVFIKHFVRRSILTADICAAVSSNSADALASRLRLPRPRTILNAVDTTFFRPAKPDHRLNSRPKRPFRLLFVGNYMLRKGSDLIPEIMRRLGSDFELHFTSGLRTEDRGLYPANMYCLGRQSQEGVRAAYRHAHALLFPSRLEGLPRVVMESLACATPVIAANTSSLPEVINHERTGLLCEANNVEAFVNAARRLASDTSLWTSMTAMARQAAVERFSLARMVDEYIDLAMELRERRLSSAPRGRRF